MNTSTISTHGCLLQTRRDVAKMFNPSRNIMFNLFSKLWGAGIVLLVASQMSCLAGVVFQLDAKKQNLVSVEGSNVVWQTLSGMRLVGNTNDWKWANDTIVNVAGAEAGALRFEDGEGFVKSVVMVIKCPPEGMRMRETLICGERIFRISGMPENEESGNLTAEVERGGYCEVSWRIDGVEGAKFEAGKTHLVEVFFSGDGLTLSRMGLGSDTGRVQWRRAWGGDGGGNAGFSEVVAFSNIPSPDVLAGVKNYLNVKWKLKLNIPSATQSQRDFANMEGVNFGSTFGLILMVK